MDINSSNISAIIARVKKSPPKDATILVNILSKLVSVEWWLGQVCTIIRNKPTGTEQETLDEAHKLIVLIKDVSSLRSSEFDAFLSLSIPGLLAIAKWTPCAKILESVINTLFIIRAQNVPYYNASISSLLMSHLDLLFENHDLLKPDLQYILLELLISMLSGTNVRYIYPADYYWMRGDGWNTYMERLLKFSSQRSEDTMLQRRIELFLTRYMHIAAYWTEEGIYTSAFPSTSQLPIPTWSPQLRKHILRRMGESTIADDNDAEAIDTRVSELHSSLSTDQCSFGYATHQVSTTTTSSSSSSSSLANSFAPATVTFTKTYALLVTSHLHLFRSAIACISNEWIFAANEFLSTPNTPNTDPTPDTNDADVDQEGASTRNTKKKTHNSDPEAKEPNFPDFHFLRVTTNLLGVHAKMILDDVDTCLIIPVNPLSTITVEPIAAQPSVTPHPDKNGNNGSGGSGESKQSNKENQSTEKRTVELKNPSRIERLRTVLKQYNTWWNHLLCVCNTFSLLSSTVTHKLETSTDDALARSMADSDAMVKLRDTINDTAVYFLTIFADSDHSELQETLKQAIAEASSPLSQDTRILPNTVPALISAIHSSLNSGTLSHAEQEEMSYTWRSRLMVPLLAVISTCLAPLLVDNPEWSPAEFQDALSLLINLPPQYQHPLPVFPLQLHHKQAAEDSPYTSQELLLQCVAPRCLRSSFFHLLPLLESRLYQTDVMQAVQSNQSFSSHSLQWLREFARILRMSIKEETHVLDTFRDARGSTNTTTTIHSSSAPVVFHPSTLTHVFKGCNIFLDLLASEKLSVQSMSGTFVQGAMNTANYLIQTVAQLNAHNLHFSGFYKTETSAQTTTKTNGNDQDGLGLSLRSALSQHLLAVAARLVSLLVRAGSKLTDKQGKATMAKKCLNELEDVTFDAFRHVFDTEDKETGHDSVKAEHRDREKQQLLFDIVMEALALKDS